MKITSIFCLIMFFTVALASAQPGAERALKKLFVEQRIALVIGNSAYQYTSKLKNPVNDAEDMAASLKKKGFQVILLKDASFKAMKKSITNFGRQLQQISGIEEKGGIGLFFYAGHGIQYNGVNYLIPVDAEVNEGDELEFNSVNANMVLSKMQNANNELNIVILDACRNNPFLGWSRSVSNGLAEMKSPRGSFVAFATSPGEVASDGIGRNGVFTKHFLKQMEVPGLEIAQMFKKVIRGVRIDTNSKQAPWQNSSMEGNFYFTPLLSNEKPITTLHKPTATVERIQKPNVEQEMWDLVKDSTEKKDIEDFLQAFPDGQFAIVARLKLKQITRAEHQEDQSSPTPQDNPAKPQETSPPTSTAPPPPSFVRMPTGVFQMGSNHGENDEKPIHLVNISQSFYISDHEVTVGEFRQFVKATVYQTQAELGGGCYYWNGNEWTKDRDKNWRDPGFTQDDSYPVACVSWNDAQSYIDWKNRNRRDGKYRLCREAEWEYAARGGTTSKWHCGNDESCLEDHAWLKSNSCKGFLCDWESSVIKTKKPNSWKIYDMHGNVWEWVQDAYGDYQVGSSRRSNADSRRVIRGGSWFNPSSDLRSANRGSGNPDAGINMLGFRLCFSY